ncbi:hypothetical protein J2Y60_001351 [Arcicella sp. BE140]|uniref:hypothetical protein n=2 Tax=Arcicella TaxID=217140 RepID=UPI00285E3952|nr:hypothetical protein [Arcicella sp. BE140]MDR6561278.1 hypothetical protein [Arcicella sp. BE51]MDR6811162.1 hypothetical protein [Arcicella sp. BE140]MDR6822512.1 hypothetical protein [Arcicella sp. BE139]
MSQSVSKKALARYIDGIKEILLSLNSHDRLIVFPIDNAASDNSERLLEFDFSKFNKFEQLPFYEELKTLPDSTIDSFAPPFRRKNDKELERSKMETKRVQLYVQKAGVFIEDYLNRSYSSRIKKDNLGLNTDLIFSLSHVPTQFRKDTEDFDFGGDNFSTTNIVVIFSDMINDTKGGYNFNKGYGIELEEGDHALNNLKRNGKIPDFSNSAVIVIGKATSGNVQTDNALRNIESFWRVYFSKAYANAKEPIVYDRLDAVHDIKSHLNNVTK